MCGRYTLRRINLARAAMDAMPMLPFEEFSEQPRFNIAPSQDVLVVRLNREGKRVMGLARWGLIPSWAKEKPKFQPINARAETLGSSGMFREAFKRRRCLIPADGFYEWKKSGDKKTKQPYFIHFKDDRPFAFGGLWERWKAEETAEPLVSCTIVTTTPNELLAEVHDRMPVIVSEKDYARWLDPEKSGADVADILKPADAKGMETYAISTMVNKPSVDGPELIQRSG